MGLGGTGQPWGPFPGQAASLFSQRASLLITSDPCPQTGLLLCQERRPELKTPLCGPQGHLLGRRSLPAHKGQCRQPSTLTSGQHSGPIGGTALICNHWSHSGPKCLVRLRRLLSGHRSLPITKSSACPCLPEGSGASRLQDPGPRMVPFPSHRLSLCCFLCRPFSQPLYSFRPRAQSPPPPTPSPCYRPVKHGQTQQNRRKNSQFNLSLINNSYS